LVEHVQEHDFSIEWFGETVRQLEYLQRALRQIDRQEQPIGLDAEMFTREF
jgi:hypothetical protein